jgi:hypothetical protein
VTRHEPAYVRRTRRTCEHPLIKGALIEYEIQLLSHVKPSFVRSCESKLSRDTQLKMFVKYHVTSVSLEIKSPRFPRHDNQLDAKSYARVRFFVVKLIGDVGAIL